MSTPHIVDIELTNACNERCAFCLRDWMRREVGVMDPSTFRRLVDEVTTYDLPRWGKVVLAGFGEPTLHPGFPELLGYAAARSLPLRVHTNGTRLSEPHRRALLQRGVLDVRVSVTTDLEAELRRITGTKRAWDALVRGVGALAAERLAAGTGPQVTLQLLTTARLPGWVQKREGPILPNPSDLARAVAFWSAVVGAPAPSRSTPLEVGSEWELGPGVSLKLCPYLPYRTLLDTERARPTGLDFGGCRRHFHNVLVFWDGSCAPCCIDVNGVMALGRLDRGTSLRDVFDGAAARANRAAWERGEPPSEWCARCLRPGAPA